LLLSFKEMGHKSGMDVISDADAKTIDLRFTTNGLMEVRSHDIDYGIVADVE